MSLLLINGEGQHGTSALYSKNNKVTAGNSIEARRGRGAV